MGNNGATTNITANALAITSGAAGVAGFGNFVSTAVNTLSATSTNFGIRLKETDSVSIVAPG